MLFPISPLIQSLQNALFLLSVALLQMSCCRLSCQSEPHNGAEVIVAIFGLPDPYLYNIIYMYLYNISNITARRYLRLG